MSIAEKEALIERLYQHYQLILDDTKGNPFLDAWNHITLKAAGEVMDDQESKDMINQWFEPIMELT